MCTQIKEPSQRVKGDRKKKEDYVLVSYETVETLGRLKSKKGHSKFVLALEFVRVRDYFNRSKNGFRDFL